MSRSSSSSRQSNPLNTIDNWGSEFQDVKLTPRQIKLIIGCLQKEQAHLKNIFCSTKELENIEDTLTIQIEL